jgi:hypothetical protein
MGKSLAKKLLCKKLFENVELTVPTIIGPAPAVERKGNHLAFVNTPSNGVSSGTGFYAGLKFHFPILAAFALLSVAWDDARAERFSINDAISQAVLTNPGVGEASANRRATETEADRARSRGCRKR